MIVHRHNAHTAKVRLHLWEFSVIGSEARASRTSDGKPLNILLSLDPESERISHYFKLQIIVSVRLCAFLQHLNKWTGSICDHLGNLILVKSDEWCFSLMSASWRYTQVHIKHTVSKHQWQCHTTGIGVGQKHLSTGQVRQFLESKTRAPYREIVTPWVGLKSQQQQKMIKNRFFPPHIW